MNNVSIHFLKRFKMKKYILSLISFIFVSVFSLQAMEETKEIARQYMREVSKIQMNTDVHVLDNFVVQEISNLVSRGEQIQFGQKSLSIESMQSILYSYLDQHPGFYTEYEKNTVSHEELKSYISTALSTANRDQTVLQLYSLGVSALDLLEKSKVDTEFERKLIYDVFAENYKTNGGCFQGVRNRMFVYYSMLLSA